jgi:Uma2 family endonuclease
VATAPVFDPEPGSVRGLKRAEYDALVATGLLDGEPVELLRGALVAMSPQDPAHAYAIRRLDALLQRQMPAGWAVAVQLPLAVSEDSEPEPDLAVVADVDSSRSHPTTAALVVEVARTSTRTDLVVKPALYAAAGVPDYWVVELAARVVHVHRGPGPAGYRIVEPVSTGVIRTTGPPELELEVATIFL